MKRKSARRKKLDAVRDDLGWAKAQIDNLERQRVQLQTDIRARDNRICNLQGQIRELTGVTKKWTQTGSVYRCVFEIGGFEWANTHPSVQDQILMDWASRIKREINRLVAEKN